MNTINCLNKTLIFSLNGQQKEIIIDNPASTSGKINVGGNIYQIHFSWNPSDALPVFTSQRVQEIDTRDILIGEPLSHNVYISYGSKEDLLGKYYPRGFRSWAETLYLMGREAGLHEDYEQIISTLGSIKIMELIIEWVDEFEEQHKYDNYSDDEEDEGMWEDYVFEFLDNKFGNI